MRSGACVATASNHTTGTWVNATHICVIVLRPDAGKRLAIGAVTVGTAASTQTIVYPALTFQRIDGTSLSLRCGTRLVAATAVGNPPTNYTAQVVEPAGAGALMSIHTRSGITGNPTSDTVTTTGTNTVYRANTVEIREIPTVWTVPVDDAVALADSADVVPSGGAPTTPITRDVSLVL